MCYKKSLNNALHYSNILPVNCAWVETRGWRPQVLSVEHSDDFEAAFYLKFMVI